MLYENFLIEKGVTKERAHKVAKATKNLWWELCQLDAKNAEICKNCIEDFATIEEVRNPIK